MNWQGKLAKLFSLIFLTILLASCTGNYCVEADEFDNEFVQVKANPVNDGIFGTVYNHNEGGQTASWHETGLRANGKPFLLHISGSWIPWYGNSVSDSKLGGISTCNFCSKKNKDENCICAKNQEPAPEQGIDGKVFTVDCDINQNDPKKCSCTKLNGKVTDEGVYHFPLNYYDKNHAIKTPDNQSGACKYSAGMGLYLGLFGVSGNETPIRVYHLFSEKTTCSINRNANGECKDANGIDQTKYVFRSANNAIFVKDDMDGNNGNNNDISNDTHHRPNEFVKLMIHDRYYSDNFGQYNVTFLEGIGRDGDTGLLEFLVSIVEDSMMGVKDENGVKKGGVLEFMYRSIVQDSYFSSTLQVCLSLYIAFFGLATLIGIVEITKKELLSRLLKLSLVIFFTTPDSWYWYNKFVVTFFKDGMDVLITMFSEFITNDIEASNPIKIAQSISSNPDGGGSRFSYVDTMLKSLFSANVTKKIWGLFFEGFFGFIYIAAIYALIFFFAYVMLLAALVYAVTLMKLIFVLALGPIFIVFSLFGQTNDMFKNWLGFIGARSLEMVMLFLILFTFVMFIDGKFFEMLHYRVCTESKNFGFFSFGILMAEVGGRGLVDWFRMFLGLAGLIYILMEILKKIPDLAGQLITIGGVANNNGEGGGNNASAMKTAGIAMGAAAGLAGSALKNGLSTGGGAAFRAIRTASRASGLSGAIDKAFDKIPVRGVRTRLRDSVIDNAISLGKKDAASNGLKPDTLAYNQHVRNFAMNNGKEGILAFQHNNKKKAALYDFDSKKIDARLAQKLEKEPLQKFLENEAKKIKEGDPSKIPLGKDMDQHLKAAARTWADKTLGGGAESINGHLKDLKGFMNKKGKLSDSDAAKKFAHNTELQDKFLQYKQERAFEKGKKASAETGKNFMRKVGYEENRANDWRDTIGLDTGKGLNPLSRVEFADKFIGSKEKRASFSEKTRAAMEKVASNYLKNGGYDDDRKKLNEVFSAKIDALGKGDPKNSFYGRQLQKKLDKDLKLLDQKRELFKQSLMDKMEKDIMSVKDSKVKDQMRQDAATELKRIEALHLAKLNSNNWDDLKDYNGKIKAGVKDGLIDIDGNSLFEAKARAELLAANAKDSPAGGNSLGMQASNAGLTVGNAGLSGGVSGVLLTAADVSGSKESVNQQLINMRSAMKSQSERAAKGAKQNMEMQENAAAAAQAEIASLKASGDTSAATTAKISNLESTASTAKQKALDFKAEQKSAEQEASRYERDIDSLK